MLLVREIMYCKPGKVRSLVEKSVAMAKLMEKYGAGKMRIMTDLSAERYWTMVTEYETENLAEFEKMMSGEDPQVSADDNKKMEELMSGYHDLVESGRREIYKLEY